VKAYVRLQLPFYDTPGTKVLDEKEDVGPAETIGIWWHETLRMLGDIEEYVVPCFSLIKGVPF
jgi:hypothetical protein